MKPTESLTAGPRGHMLALSRGLVLGTPWVLGTFRILSPPLPPADYKFDTMLYTNVRTFQIFYLEGARDELSSARSWERLRRN